MDLAAAMLAFGKFAASGLGALVVVYLVVRLTTAAYLESKREYEERKNGKS